MTITAEQVLAELQAHMKELFQIDPERVTLEARLNEDLDLDSIDAIDLAVRVEEQTGRRLPEDKLREVRVVGDIVKVVVSIVNTEPEASVKAS